MTNNKNQTDTQTGADTSTQDQQRPEDNNNADQAQGQDKSTANEETPKTNEETPSEEENTSNEEEETSDEEEEEPVEMVEVPKSRLVELETAEERFREELKRERAESINYRKRLQKQRDQFSEMASARVLTKVLAVQDDLKRVVDNANDEIPDAHLEGIQMVMQRLEGIFNQEGVEIIKVTEGETRYDPNEMEAVVSQPIPDVPPKTVVGVISQGFKKGDRILRPAKVMISKQPEKEDTGKEASSEIEENNDRPQNNQTQEESTSSNPDQSTTDEDQTGEEN